MDTLDKLLQQISKENDESPTLMVREFSDPVQKGKLCLNMIVKNESKIITRLLDTVIPIIDTYCICDTGSTDDTANIIREHMQKANKPGEVFFEPFKNFGYNRTVALQRGEAWGEYLLLLDADMKLVIDNFNKNDLVANGYSILQKGGSLEYYNTRIVKSGIGVTCKCPTHEYYDFPKGGGHVKLSTLWIDDVGDGGAKANKFERDIQLLSEALKDESDPLKDRYNFYLANSYRDLGKYEDAIKHYKARIELGGWIEEVFYSCYELGNIYMKVNDPANAIYWWLEGYNRHPKRAESLYEVVKYYRIHGKHTIGQALCNLALQISYPHNDVLFIKPDVYKHLIYYEHSILAYYTGTPVDHYKYLDLIGSGYNRGNVLDNYRFYVKKLIQLPDVKEYDFCGKTTKPIMGREDDFVSSSPCIVPLADGYLLNVRYVNYTIRSDGSYHFKHSDGKITTLNLLHWLRKDFSILDSHWFDKVQDESLRYQGVEDVKIFPHRDSLLFLGTVENPQNGSVAVGHGVYNTSLDRLQSVALPSPQNRGCEKNWCYFHDAKGSLHVVYEWSPLTIGRIENNAFVETLRITSGLPTCMGSIRGSSHGCLVQDEIWFLCHLVQYSTPRHYYHCIIILDAHTLQYKRHSILFKFHGDCIEYSLGMIVEPTQCIFSFSRMDRTSAVMVVPMHTVMKELF